MVEPMVFVHLVKVAIQSPLQWNPSLIAGRPRPPPSVLPLLHVAAPVAPNSHWDKSGTHALIILSTGSKCFIEVILENSHQYVGLLDSNLGLYDSWRNYKYLLEII